MNLSYLLDLVFVLALGVFSIAFWLIAAQSVILTCARWFGIAFFCAALAMVLQSFAFDADVGRIGAVLSGFLAVSASVAGICGLLTYYKVRINWKLVTGFLSVVLIANWLVQFVFPGPVIGSLVRQVPNAFTHAFAAYVIFNFGRKKALEWILSISLLFSVLFFLANPMFSMVLQASVPSDREAIMVSFGWMWHGAGIIFGVSNGLLMILTYVRDMIFRARVDDLSGLLTRKTFEDEMDVLICRPRTGASVGSLVIADLDHFKQINDTYGHGQGDIVIKSFSELLRSCAVDGVIVGRLGGEEFGVFLPETGLQSATEFAQAVCKAFCEEKFPVSGPPLFPTVSVGVAEYALGEPVTELFRRADVALYRAKTEGRNRVCPAVPSREPGYRPASFLGQKSVVAA